jgi:formate dehydrogenase subunit delta
MDIQNLVNMANRIGQFFESFSDHNEALAGIGNHIHKFWEPRMRRELLCHFDEHAGEGLSPIMIEALGAHRSMLS